MKLANGKIVCYGAGQVLDWTKPLLESIFVIPDAIFDRDQLKQGKNVVFGNSEIMVKDPKEIIDYDYSENLIIVTVGRRLYKEVYSELSVIIKNARIVFHQAVIYEILKEKYKQREDNWSIDYENFIERWISLLDNEVSHHGAAISSNRNCDSSTWCRERVIPRLQKYPIEENAVLLDIGAGCTLKYDSVINGKNIKYKPVDVLKYSYDYFRDRFDFKVPHETKFAFAEHLSCFFDDGEADYIVFDNSLDHTIDPLRCLIEAFRVLAVDGVLSLRHAGAESRGGVAGGLHQWDFLLMDGQEFVIASQTNFMNVSRLFAPYAEIDAYEEPDNLYCSTAIVVNIRKQRELDKHILDQYDSSRDVGTILSVLFKLISQQTAASVIKEK